MTPRAKTQARRAELERQLIFKMHENQGSGGFVDWLEAVASRPGVDGYALAAELVDIYEGMPP